MKPTPAGWPRMSASVFYNEPKDAIAWLCNAFGFELRMKVEGDDGKLHHSELCLGDSLVMASGTDGNQAWHASYRSPKSIGGAITQALAFFVDDVDAHHAQAVRSGAQIVRPLETNDYGPEYWADRSYGALDPEGHLWWFMQRIRNPGSPA